MEVPDYVKESSILPEDVAALTDSQFGRSQSREFPLDTPGHVYLSYGHCKSAGIEEPDLIQKILKAGAFFSIESDLAAIDSAFSSLTKKASEEKRYAIYLDFGIANPQSPNPGEKVGGVHGFYPINSPAEIEESAVKVANERTRLPLEIFAEASRNLVKAAAEQSVPERLLPVIVQTYGVDRVPSAEYVLKAAADRSAATGDTIYADIAQAAIENEEGRPSHEFAELWLQADRLNDFKSASKHDPDPFMILASGRTVAEVDREIESWTVLNDSAVPVTKLASVTEKDLTRRFSPAVVAQLMPIVKRAAQQAKGSELTVELGRLEQPVQVAFLHHLAA